MARTLTNAEGTMSRTYEYDTIEFPGTPFLTTSELNKWLNDHDRSGNEFVGTVPSPRGVFAIFRRVWKQGRDPV